MHKYILSGPVAKTLGSAVLCGNLLLTATGLHAADNEIAQVPLSLAEGVPPNMLLTLDDSGSMRFAFVPDAISSTADTRRAKSSTFNPMYYNPDIEYEIPPFFNANGEQITLSTSFGKAWHNGFDTSVGSINLASQYRVAWDVPVNAAPGAIGYGYSNYSNYKGIGNTYRLAKNPLSDFPFKTISAVAAYYYKYNNRSGCSVTNDNCYTKVDVGAAEQQNFAIWYSFYRNRALATLSAAAVAFYNLSPDVRFSWQALTNCNSFDSQAIGCGKNKFLPYTASHKGSLYSWFKTMKFDGGTPLRAALDRAGKFLKKDKAWQKYLNNEGQNNASNKYACRPSYHILMTDGMWNGDNGTPASPFRHDNTSFQLPDGTQYSARRPYKDNASNTLADLAMHYWATDLSNLENKVPAYMPYRNENATKQYWDSRNNPATWQSMSNFIVGLSLTSSLNQAGLPWDGRTHAGQGYDNLLANKDWPAAATDNANNVYDLWHAAINSRGEFYSADSPEDMVKAFKDVLSRIADRKSSAAQPGIGMNSESDGDNPLEFSFYQTGFDSVLGWTGELAKVVKKRVQDPVTGALVDTVIEAWKASEKVPAHNNRVIKMAGNNDALIDFKSNKLSSSAKYNGKSLDYWLDINPEPSNQKNYTAAQRLDYLRGDTSNASETDKNMRVRAGKLGDFLASQPVLVVNKQRYLEGAANRLEGNTAYSQFRNDIKNRKSMVYVGGNDGMLHGFDATEGKESFAFVPTPVFPYLNQLTGKGYSHRFYVDGSPVVADVFDNSANKWRTILVGTLRAGGKGLFALDVTDPSAISLLWELHEYNMPTKDKAGKALTVKPGYSFSKPTIARLHNGRWAVVTGNGYKGDNTNNGKAALYIIDALSGELTRSLEVQGSTAENGLSSPRLADFDGDGIADYAYAGDWQGNLWRFDLLGDNAATGRDIAQGSIFGDKSGSTDGFNVSYGGKPMFTAKSTTGNRAQPITAAPNISRHPSKPGYLISFGTGRYVEIGDKSGETSHAQTLYAIWDQNTRAEATTASGFPIARSRLHKQEFESVTTGTGVQSGIERAAKTIKKQTGNARLNWNTTPQKLGWYLDLAVGTNFAGEMVVEEMRLLGNVLLFQTLLPNSDPCANGVSNWLYAVDVRFGGVTEHHVFDTRGLNNLVVSGLEFGTEGGVSVSQDEDGYKANALNDVESIMPDPNELGRQSWRLIPLDI